MQFDDLAILQISMRSLQLYLTVLPTIHILQLLDRLHLVKLFQTLELEATTNTIVLLITSSEFSPYVLQVLLTTVQILP